MFESGQLTVLNMQEILPNRFQPRIRFDSEKLEELAESIGKYGVIQPIVVRPVGNKFEIIAGERRFKASRLANRSTIPAIIVNLSDKDSEEIALLENIQRQQLSPIEEAVSYKRILDMGYITQEGLAKKLGKSQSTIANKIRLLNLDDEVQKQLYDIANNENNYHTNSYGNTNDSLLIMIDNETYAVLGYAGKSDYDLTNFVRQPGSTIKPILVYAPALEKGLVSPDTLILDEEINRWIEIRKAMDKAAGYGIQNKLHTNLFHKFGAEQIYLKAKDKI